MAEIVASNHETRWPEPTTLFVGLDVHTESTPVAHASAYHASEIVCVGQVGTRDADLDELFRRHRDRVGIGVFSLDLGSHINV